MSRLSEEMQKKHERVQKRVTSGVIERLRRIAELEAQVVLTPDEELELQWKRGIAMGEANVQRAMHSLDRNTKIDYAYDLTRQLQMAYKKKLGDASGYLLD